MGYIEYRTDNFSLKNNSGIGKKKTMHRIKTSSEIEKNIYIQYEDYPFSIREKEMFPGFWQKHGLPQPPVIDRTEKCPLESISAGFHTCFRYGNIVIPMVFAFGSVCALQNSTPNSLGVFLCPTPEGLKKCIFYLGDHYYTCIYIYTYIYISYHTICIISLILCYIIVYYIILYCIILYYISYYTMLYHIILYHIILYHMILYYIILYIILLYIILLYIILLYIILLYIILLYIILLYII